MKRWRLILGWIVVVWGILLIVENLTESNAMRQPIVYQNDPYHLEHAPAGGMGYQPTVAGAVIVAVGAGLLLTGRARRSTR
jgi:hypothetical protein